MINKEELEAIGIFKNNEKLNIFNLIVISIVVAIIIIISILSQLNTTTTTSTSHKKLELTSAMIEDIKENYVGDLEYASSSMGKNTTSGILTGRIVEQKYGSYLPNLKEIISIDVTSSKKTDKYTYTAYIVCKYKDNYNSSKTKYLQIDYTAEKDTSEKEGYAIYSSVK